VQSQIQVNPSNQKLTELLANRALAIQFDQLPEEIKNLASQCILDWIGVTLAGSKEPLMEILVAEMGEQGGNPDAAIIGHALRLPTLTAALLNGTASHALDYDDVNMSMSGHPTVAVLPGLLALAEQRQASGAALIAAFVAGYETACSIGARLGRSHYARGFHATATIGSFGSAAACAHLLQLTPQQTTYALGIAGTQAAGLKSMFGTMCKPLHAGRAAYNGLFAALLAARGFDSRSDVLEATQGFAASQSDGLTELTAQDTPEGGYYLRNNLFKYHASCYLTHAAIECGRDLLRSHAFDSARIRNVTLRVNEGSDKVCNIANPETGLEAKFSLRQTTAFALAGLDTARLDTYSKERINDPRITALRDKVTVIFHQGQPHTATDMQVELEDGNCYAASHDAGIPTSSVQEQGERITEKFLGLATQFIGHERATSIASLTGRLGQISSTAELTRLLSSTL
jgi:2-methylcitrate dehydratase PrpD